MSYTVFARKYRPQKFDEIVGQDHIVRTLKNAIAQTRLAQAYLFVGPRGTGKTSTARIFAKALNCEKGPTTEPCGECERCKEIAAGNSMNVLEFDAASNTQVDKIREIIIDTVKYLPSGNAPYKVYIVDEVHMLSTSSFNALLKTLEEPPAHVKFIFATTDVQKVPTTIISRCQRFDLRRISTPEIAKHLLHIAGKENFSLSNDAAEAIARGAEGGLRDAESMLDQLVSFCGEKIEEADVLNIFGFTSAHTTTALVGHLIAGETGPALALIHEQAEAGKDLTRLMADLIVHLRNLLVLQCDPASVNEELTPEAAAALSEQSGRISRAKLLGLIEQFAEAEGKMKSAPSKKMHFEVAVIRAVSALNEASLTDVLDALTALRGGAPLPPRTETARPAPRPTATAPKSAAAPADPPPAAGPRLRLSEAVEQSLSKPSNTTVAPTPTSARVEEKPEPAAPVAPLPTAHVEPAVEAAPAPKPAAKPEPSVAAGVSASELWPRLVGRVRKDRPLIQGWVEAGQLVELTADSATLAFPHEGALALEACESRNNRGFLEGLISELAGTRVTLKFETRAGLVPEKVAVVQSKPEAPADPMVAFKDDPLIRKALEIFRGEIVQGQ